MRRNILTMLIFIIFSTNIYAQTDKEALQECLVNLTPFVIHYNLSASVLDVTSEHRLKKHGNIWTYRSYADAGFVGQAKEMSYFSLSNGFQLQKYSSYRRIAFNKTRRHIKLNWYENSYSTSKNKEGTFDKSAILFDKASQQLAIQCYIRNGKEKFNLDLATKDGIENYDYEVVSSNDRLETEMGSFDAIKVQQIRDDEREIFFWVAPELDHFPIRFVYKEKNDDTVVGDIKSFRYL